MSWLSEQWKKSKRKKTGIFSWGDTNILKLLDLYEPGAGTAIDMGFDKLADGSGKGNISAKDGIEIASFGSNNQLVLYGLVGLVAYKVFFK